MLKNEDIGGFGWSLRPFYKELNVAICNYKIYNQYMLDVAETPEEFTKRFQRLDAINKCIDIMSKVD